MKRLALQQLAVWGGTTDRRPLLIRGARQVGKTWLVREYAKNYDHFIEVNLESDPEYIPLFRSSFGKPEDLCKAIALLSGKKIVAGKTLLFLDEIQQSKEALLSLRYFKEKMPELHVVAAGSLLEFAFSDFSFPVGRIEFMHLFPMNFQEYLLAKNRQDLVTAIAEADVKRPLSAAVHDRLIEEVSAYWLVGGLPDVLKTYIESSDLAQCQNQLQMLAATYREDFHKYASKTNIEYLRSLFQNIPRFLGQKFKYSKVDEGVRSRELSAALNLLCMAGLAYKVHHSSANGLPLDAQTNLKKFKVFFIDIGLCQRVLGLSLAEQFMKRKALLANQGGLAEQFVAQELLSYTPSNQNPALYYWQREHASATAEVDLITEHQSHVLPIEIKSQRGTGLKSMRLFLEEKALHVPRGLKISSLPFSKLDKIEHWPFYGLQKFSLLK